VDVIKRRLGVIATAGTLLIGLFANQPALAQKSGGVLKISFFDNPASMSLHEEATGAALRPMMGVFNNLVMYDQHVAQNSPDSIIPDLATSWVWSEDGKELTFSLRQGVKWHDGKPFTAADVKCTWDLLLGIGSEKLRVNPRKTWYLNLDRHCSRCWRRGGRRSIPATCRRATCAPIRSAPARSNSSSSRRTRWSEWRKIRTTGNRAGPISTASSGTSSRMSRRET
jgi:hypothetical protein